MKTSSRLLAAAAVVALGIGVAGPATAAHGAKTRPHAAKTTITKATSPKPSPVKHAPKPKVDQVVVRQTLHDVTVLDSRLASVAQTSRTVGLSTSNLAALIANVATDRASLASIAASVRTATDPAVVSKARADLKSVQPQIYSVAINRFRAAQELTEQIAAARATYADGTEQAVLLDQAAAQVSQAETLVRTVTARSTQAPLQTAQALLDGAAGTLEYVASLDAASGDTTGDTTGTDTGTDTGATGDTTGTGTVTDAGTGVVDPGTGL